MAGGAREDEPFDAGLDDRAPLMDLPELRSAQDPCGIAAALLDALVHALHPEFLYLRLEGGGPGGTLEMIRPPPGGDAQRALGILRAQLARARQAEKHAAAIENPLGTGEVRLAMFPLGLAEDLGIVAAASPREDFPSRHERLMLTLAGNLAAIRLHEVRRDPDPQGRGPGLGSEPLALAALVHHSSDFIGLATPAGTLVFLNAAGRALVGVAAEGPLPALQIFDLVADEDRGHLHGVVWPRVLAEGRWEGESGLRNRDSGAELAADLELYLIRDPGSGAPAAVGAVGRDVTQRKRAEAGLVSLKDQLAGELGGMKRLNELNLRLQRAGELQPILELALDASLELLEGDSGIVQLCNRDGGEAQIVAQRGFGHALFHHLRAAGTEKAPWGAPHAMRQRVVVEDVERDEAFALARPIARRAGFRAFVSTPLHGTGDETMGVLSVFFGKPHRPSERQLRFADHFASQAGERIRRQRIEAALMRSEAYLAEGQRMSHTGSWAYGAARGELFWSREHCRIWGVDPDTVPTYGSFLESVHPDDRPRVKRAFDEALAQATPFDAEYRILRPGGSLRHVHSLGHPVLDDSGALVELVGTVIDTTEGKNAEEALSRARDDLAHVSRVTAMGELSASIAHEVNQPLAAVVTNANACLHWLTAPSGNVQEALAAARRIIRDANRASEVITRIRAFLTRGDLRRTRLHPGELLREVATLVKEEARAHGVAVVVRDDPGLPRVAGDRVQLQQVLRNLAMNAIEAMADVEGRGRTLEMGAAREGASEVRLYVSDSGIGIHRGSRDRVFEAFYTTKPQGMGMGLAISRSLIEAHGGRLWATANPDAGETFHFTLPTRMEPRG